MTSKIFAVQCDQKVGFVLDEPFYNRVLEKVEDTIGTETLRDKDNLEVAHAIITHSIAEFMATFQIKEN